MSGTEVNIAGIIIPSNNPAFLTFIAIHVLAGLTCVVTGIVAMLSRKGPGRHPLFGRIYFKSYIVVFITTTILSIIRWEHDYHLFIIGVFAFAAVLIGQSVIKKRGRAWSKIHIIGMGMSYVLFLAAFCLDNGRFLPVWKDMPYFAYWLIPAAVGIPLIGYALIKYRKLG